MSTNYEMKIEKRERYYRIIFTPDINYGNISVKVFTRKEAYAKYHEIKNIVYHTRPGRLVAYEYLLDETGHYKENYLCACKTGKEVDAMAIFKNISKELHQISRIYDAQQNKTDRDYQSRLELDIIHGIEYVDLTSLSDEQLINALNRLQTASILRRQAKNNEQDYKEISNDLAKMKNALKSIEKILNNNLGFRKRMTIESKGTKKTGAQVAVEMYLESMGLDPQQYLEK